MSEAQEKIIDKIQRALKTVVVPYSKDISAIWHKGMLPVAVYQPGKGNQKLIRKITGSKTTTLFGVNKEDVTSVFSTFADQKWLAGKRPLWLIIEEGNLCLEPTDKGWEIAEGTRDKEQN